MNTNLLVVFLVSVASPFIYFFTCVLFRSYKGVSPITLLPNPSKKSNLFVTKIKCNLPWLTSPPLSVTFHSNCQAVQVCGGLKTMCELISATSCENVLERSLWALGMLANDVK